MPSSAAFELLSEALERETFFDRLAARGTVRLALRQAGLDPRSVTPQELIRVVDTHLPAELECRGVENCDALCAKLKTRVAVLEKSQQSDSASSLFSSENLGKPR